MATVVNTPSAGSGDGGSGMGFFLGMIVLLIIVVLFFMYGLPVLRSSVRQPAAPSISVPDQIDVNVDTPQQQQPQQ